MNIFIYVFKLLLRDLFSQWSLAYMNSVTNLVEMNNGSGRNRGILIQKHFSLSFFFLVVFYAAWHLIHYIMTVRKTLVKLDGEVYKYFSHDLGMMDGKCYLCIMIFMPNYVMFYSVLSTVMSK